MIYFKLVIWSLFWRMPLWTLGYVWGRAMLKYYGASDLFIGGRDDALRGFVNKYKRPTVQESENGK